MFELAAIITFLLHLFFIVFVTLGSFLIFIRKKLIFFHFPALCWAVYAVLSRTVCPLTYLEQWLLIQANREQFSSSFINHYLVPLVYPKEISYEELIIIVLLLLLINIFMYFLFAKSFFSKN